MAISGGDGSIILTTKVDESGLSKGLSKLKSGVGACGKAFAVAGAAGVAAFAGITKAAVDSYAEFEQLKGGVQKIFDEIDYSKIAADAGEAYKTMGMSANEYLGVMTTVGANFASTLGDAKGYEVAKQGMQAISDFASGTGRSIDELSEKYQMITKSTSSYQSIADQFAGILPATSAGFLEQAQAAGFLSESYTKLTDVPMAEYQEAVTQMLAKGVDALGLTSNTAMEATTTLSGSMAMMQASWQNLLTGMADPTQDFDALLQNFITSIGAFAGNLLPVIQTATQGVLQMVQGLLPELGSMVSEMLPMVVEGASGIISGIVSAAPMVVQAISGLLPELLTALGGIIGEVANQLPSVMQTIVSALPSVIESIVSVLPTLIPQVVSGISQAVTLLANNASSIIQPLISALPDILISVIDAIMSNLPLVISGTISLVMALVSAIPEIIDGLVQALPTVISLVISGLLKCLPQILAGLGMIVIGVVKSLPSIFASLIEGVGNIFVGIWDGIKEVFASIGEWFKKKFHEAKEKIGEAFKPVVDWFSGIWNSITGVFASVGSWFKTKFNEAVSGIKNAWSGVKSFFTSKWNEITSVFKNAKDKFLSIGKNIVAGIKQGIKNAWNNLKNWFSGLFGDLIGIAKKILGIKSPSREFMWIAQMIVAGLTKGIDKYGHLAIRGVEELSRNVVDVFKEIIPEMAKGILSDTRTEVQKVVDEMNEELLESERFYNEESERLKDSNLESDKEYLDNLKEIADKERKLYDARKKDVENLKVTIVNAYSDMASKALDSISELQKTQESFAEKLAGYGNLTYEKTYTNKYGMKVTENWLSDLSDQTEFLEEYYDMLMAVKDRGNVPKEFFSVIRDMGLEEGLEYANSLLELSDEDFANYIREWERKQETAKNISKALYEDEATELATSINDEFDSLKDDMFGIGKDSAGEFGDGFIQQLKFLAHDIRYALQSALGGVTIGGIGPVMSGEGDVIKVPALARGGIAPRKMLAMIGERGREAVLPLENNTGWMDVLADRISARMGGASSTVVLEVDGREFGRAVVEQGNRENRRIGTRLVSR